MPRITEDQQKLLDDMENDPALRESKFRQFMEEEVQGRINLPLVDRRIYNDEINRALYLNSRDPEKYNLAFFEEYFNVERRELKKIFDSISFPIINHLDLKVFRIHRFVYL